MAGLRHHHIANTAYPIHHQTTMRPYRVRRLDIESTTVAAWEHTDRLGLYVHVPFCAARCRYCEYTVVENSSQEAQDAYLAALLREFALYRDRLETKDKTLIGFDIGGGTPSFVAAATIGRVIEAARSTFRFSPGTTISIETTPVIAAHEPAKIRAYTDMGIGRISMGVQTTHFDLAQALGREYGGLSLLESAVCNIRDAGFRRFNIDLMYGFADQSLEMWRSTVENAIALGPEYVTLYRMRYKGTRMAREAAQVTLETVNRLEETARSCLLAAGYEATEGKNTYSRIPGDAGTSDYLTERVVRGTPYLGLGLGAQSLSHTTLSYNLGAASKTLRPYLEAVHAGQLPIQDLYHLPREVAMAKMIAVSFYFGQIHGDRFEEKFGVRVEKQFPREVDFASKQGLMEPIGPYLRLTPKGVQRFGGVVALFYAGAVQDYLVHLGSGRATDGDEGRE